MPITRLADLPISEREPLELLALADDERLAVDREYAGYGWAWIDGLELSAPARPSVILPRALVLALHSADEQVDPDDVELELEVGAEIVRAPLSRVLAVKLPTLPRFADLVLALCNPSRTKVRWPTRVAVRMPSGSLGRIHYGLGDVTSWLDRDADGGEHIRLAARSWAIAEPVRSAP
jgi:hypothetical protein